MPTVLITGGNRGIGLSLCCKFANMGYHVFMGVRNHAKGVIALNDLGNPSNITLVILDLSHEVYIKEVANSLAAETFDIIINNAAAQLDWEPNGSAISTLNISQERLTNVYQTNVFAPILVAKYFLPLLKRGSKIINVTSGVGDLTHPDAQKDFQIAYATSKAALTLVTKKMAAALESYGISVNCIDPGWCKTQMGGEFATFTADEGAQSIINACLLNTNKFITGRYFKDGHNLTSEI